MTFFELPDSSLILVVPDWAVWLLAGIVLVELVVRLTVWVRRGTG